MDNDAIEEAGKKLNAPYGVIKFDYDDEKDLTKPNGDHPLVFILNYMAFYRELHVRNELDQFTWTKKTPEQIYSIGAIGPFGVGVRICHISR